APGPASAAPAAARGKAASASPAPPVAPGPLTAERFPVKRVVLDNGLTVLMHEDHSVPTVAFWQWYRVGSRDERPGITGISHYFEHMMFNGSKNVPPKFYDQMLESNGGYSNAFTDHDMTAYFEEIASDRLGIALYLDSDRMAALSLLPEQLKSEIEVVKEERRLRTDNDIEGMLNEQLYATAFNASPYRWPVVGWMGDLNRITRDEMQEYFRIHYAPDNCILVLTGDFQTATALDSIRAYFGAIPRQSPPPDPVDSEPEQRGERRALVRYPAETVSFQIGYKSPGVRDSSLEACAVLAWVLGGGESSRLHQALVYERQIALSATAHFGTQLLPGLFEIDVEMKPGHTAQEGLDAVDSVLAALREKGPQEREIEKARNGLEARFIHALETNNDAAQQLGYYEHVYGDYHVMFSEQARYRALAPADCRRAAKALFNPARRTVAVLVPLPEAGEASR
ncbi:MAG: M16 family metallopeptidase, partial [Candidatus Eiseniibacteriota bacterium]